MRGIKLQFEIASKYGHEWSREYSITDILENGIDQERILDDMADDEDTQCSCFNESNNHCECESAYWNGKVINVRVIDENQEGKK